MDDKPMPVVKTAKHIGIHKSEKNSVLLTVEENIKKARRTLYSLMGSGLHGTNGLEPETILTLVKTYVLVLPILTYGLEKSLTTLNLYHKKLLKQLLSLSTNTTDPAIYILSGMIPIEAELHIKILTLFGTISRSDKNSNECRIAERQLKLKSFNSNKSLEMVRKRLVDIIIDMGSELLAKSYFAEEVDLVQLIANPFYYTVNKCNNEIVQNIAGQLERVCRQLINNLHMKRYDLLTKQQKCEKKNNLS
ncbi:unnamed protein product [Mytilus edulis]|uniref:Uncharacterized protein n=1 Tax=Mytilus edulis TaxID=6550 RepID=A0A8S3U0X5_MYTED|nr:unnamed protein product [Mytilus edulis]